MKMHNMTQKEHYAIDSWSENYFSINQSGSLCVNYGDQLNDQIPLSLICQLFLQAYQKNNNHFPIILHFDHILKDRIKAIDDAFNNAINQNQYKGNYQLAYPVKANPSERIIKQLSQFDHLSCPLSFEVGSKTELLAVIGSERYHSNRRIICNGFKDQAYLNLCQLAHSIGFEVIVVIENSNEYEIIQTLYENHLNLPFQLGLRLKPAHIDHHALKFGLSLSDAFKVVKLMPISWQNQLILLHLHNGTQISTLDSVTNDLKRAMAIYRDLKQYLVNLDIIDLGGGLGINYQQNGSDTTDYTIESYANTIVEMIKTCCDDLNVNHPNLITESGRASVSHCSVLMTNIHHLHCPKTQTRKEIINQITSIETLPNDLLKLAQKEQFQQLLTVASDLFYQKLLPIKLYAEIEYLVQLLLSDSQPSNTTAWLNLSIFQSLPDHWGLNHPFPILPTEDLNEPITQMVTLFDISCDKDGQINRFVTSNAYQNTKSLPVPQIDKESLLAFFLTGSYQEALGSYHNLIGRATVVGVSIDSKANQIHFYHQEGDTHSQILDQFGYDSDKLYAQILNKLNQADCLNITDLATKFKSLFNQTPYLQSPACIKDSQLIDQVKTINLNHYMNNNREDNHVQSKTVAC